MPASHDLHFKPSQPKNIISRSNLRSALTSNSNPNPDHERTGTEEDELSKLARFGPTYGDDTEANRKAKDSAWKHILQKSGGDEAEGRYMRSIMEIEKEAIDSYDSAIADQLRRAPHEFRRMMVRDGCFFLQLAFHILGAGELLDYPQQNPYFGRNSDSASWIPAMFFAGNQIPNVVIHALMEQAFFQKVIKKGIVTATWQRPTDDLAKLVLYLTVVEPQLDRLNPNSSKLAIFRRKPPQSGEPPSNILNALHNLVVGSGADNDPIYSEMREFHDLEAGSDDGDIKIPSAGELYKLGIKMRKGQRGIINIRFKNLGFSAFLYLPPLTIDGNTEHLLMSLASHEMNLNESDRELTAYLRFMRDLARTYKDFKILKSKGIIQVKDDRLKGTMVHMLDQGRMQALAWLGHCPIRRKITDYGGPPWRLISITLAVLAVVQTIFTVLSYFIPRK